MKLLLKIICLVFCFFSFISQQAFADDNSNNIDNAITACADKESGDLCTFNDPAGNSRNGTCSPNSNDTLACVPYQVD